MVYVYPVVSRRAGGVSVGVNLNPNNACNWRCAYCQVPGLVHGSGPRIDLAQLESELDRMLTALTEGDYMERHVPPEARRLNDVAFSGNGEPTTSPHFASAVRSVVERLGAHGLLGEIDLVLITNGSSIHARRVQDGLRAMAAHRGVAWFKFDRADQAGQLRWNGNRPDLTRTAENLERCCELIPTWIQTLMAAWDGQEPGQAECDAYLDWLATHAAGREGLGGVLLYGLARPSHQPEAPRLSALPAAWLEAFAERIRALGLAVRVSP